MYVIDVESSGLSQKPFPCRSGCICHVKAEAVRKTGSCFCCLLLDMRAAGRSGGTTCSYGPPGNKIHSQKKLDALHTESKLLISLAQSLDTGSEQTLLQLLNRFNKSTSAHLHVFKRCVCVLMCVYRPRADC